MTDTPSARLTAARRKAEQLRAQAAAIEARVKADERKAEARRLIVIGATVLRAGTTGWPFQSAEALKEWLDGHVTRPQDRRALGLNPRD